MRSLLRTPSYNYNMRPGVLKKMLIDFSIIKGGKAQSPYASQSIVNGRCVRRIIARSCKNKNVSVSIDGDKIVVTPVDAGTAGAVKVDSNGYIACGRLPEDVWKTLAGTAGARISKK